MRRVEKEISKKNELEDILMTAPICRLGLLDHALPYIVPLNFGYKDGCLYFHSASHGKKIDLLKRNTTVCFEIDIDHRIIPADIPCRWSTEYRSIIGYGTARFITNLKHKKKALSIILNHYSPKVSFDFPKDKLQEVIILRVDIITMTGKKS
jgi:nitroimidazol reductase NimA-like FMN-containing flavoprotein (pyridoxamine 5'-phosphate oxidase superfamily)